MSFRSSRKIPHVSSRRIPRCDTQRIEGGEERRERKGERKRGRIIDRTNKNVGARGTFLAVQRANEEVVGKLGMSETRDIHAEIRRRAGLLRFIKNSELRKASDEMFNLPAYV